MCMYMQGPQRPEGIGFCRSGVTSGCKLPSIAWSHGLLEEQVLLITEPFLQAQANKFLINSWNDITPKTGVTVFTRFLFKRVYSWLPLSMVSVTCNLL